MANTVTVWGTEWLSHLPAPLPELFRRCEIPSRNGPGRLVSYDLNSKHVGEWAARHGVEKTLSALEHLSEAIGFLAEPFVNASTSPDDVKHRSEVLQRWWFVIVRAIESVRGQPLLHPACRTSTVVALAEGIHADHAFDRLPILADALQDAGCEDDALLDHCRTPGPHGHGCCVVDLVLGMG